MTEVFNKKLNTNIVKKGLETIQIQVLYNQTEKIQSLQSIYLEYARSTPLQQDFVVAWLIQIVDPGIFSDTSHSFLLQNLAEQSIQ